MLNRPASARRHDRVLDSAQSGTLACIMAQTSSMALGQRLRSALRPLVYGLADVASPRLAPVSDSEKHYLAELVAEVAALPPEPAHGSGAGAEWSGNVERLRRHILHDDPREFLRWPVVLRTMFVTFDLYVLRELGYLRRRDWPRWKDAIRESPVGRPFRYPFYPASSGNLIHHAYHLAVFEDSAARTIPELSCIVEFGGGYGGMCRLAHQLGFRGTYVVCDLPCFTALQKYYLRTLGLPVAALTGAPAPNQILCISSLDDLRAVCAGLPNQRDAMLLGTWSLSESPPEIRELVLDATRDFGHFLLAYQNRFAGVDNVAYFTDWADRRRDVAWDRRAIQHLPGSHYLMGRRKDA
jgi:hypothetical protein